MEQRRKERAWNCTKGIGEICCNMHKARQVPDCACLCHRLFRLHGAPASSLGEKERCMTLKRQVEQSYCVRASYGLLV